MVNESKTEASGTDRFFIIGAQRSGTTSLWHALDAHPRVGMARPVRPEPKHFLAADSTTPAELERYKRTFFEQREVDLFGEKSTSYLEYSEVAKRIASAFPRARIIVSLRDPIERAVSNYWFSVANGYEVRPPGEALRSSAPQSIVMQGDAELSTSPHDYLGRSRYERLLPPWIEEFGSQLCVVILEESIAESWRTVGDFLGLSPPLIAEGLPMNAAQRQKAIPREVHEWLSATFEPTVSWVNGLLGRRVTSWNQSGADSASVS